MISDTAFPTQRPRAWLRHLCAGLCLMAAGLGPAAAADGLFSPVLYVDGRAITGFELQQRSAFLQVVRTPGDLQAAAREALIDERLQMQAAERLAITATPEDVQQGLEEFSQRANLSVEAFTAELAKAGVEMQTVRDLVEAGILWREVVRSRFGPFVRITEADVDRAIAAAVQTGGVRVLLSELVVPYDPDRKAEATAFVEEIRASIRTQADFAAAATEYSASPSAQKGGEVDWMPLANLPPALGPQILDLGPGRVSEPLSVPGALVLFFVRGLSDDPVRQIAEQEVEYAQFLLPAGEGLGAAIAALRAGTDSCEDLYTQARGLPADRLLRDKKPLGQVPGDIGLELAKLDPGEASTALTRGGFRVFLMLCARSPIATEDSPTREQIRTRLLNRELSLRADNHLRELRANAIFREP